MGRSQVAYNRRHGRPGARGGRGGRGGGRGAATATKGRRAAAAAAAAAPGSTNAWRYERKRLDEGGGGGDDDDDDDDEGADVEVDAWTAAGGGGGDLDGGIGVRRYHGEYGPASHDVTSTATLLGGFGACDPESSGMRGIGPTAGRGDGDVLDLSALSRALSRLPTRERLRLPAHVAEFWDERCGARGGEGGKRTVSELRLLGSCGDAPATARTESPAAPVRAGAPAPTVEDGPAECKGREEVKGAYSGGGDGDDDDGDRRRAGEGDGIEDGEEEEEEEDLDAWLDSVIS